MGEREREGKREREREKESARVLLYSCEWRCMCACDTTRKERVSITFPREPPLLRFIPTLRRVP